MSEIEREAEEAAPRDPDEAMLAALIPEDPQERRRAMSALLRSLLSESRTES